MPFTGGNVVTGYVGFGLIKWAGYSLVCYWAGRWYVQRKAVVCELDQDGRIGHDWPCANCDYNVRGLMASGTCPECGHAIDVTKSSSFRPPLGLGARNPFIAGLVRTLIGMVFGTLYWFLFGPNVRGSEVFLMLVIGLAPIRIIEWWIVVWLFFDRELRHRGQDWRTVGFGTLWSYLLDLPALLGFCVTGGVSLC